jgi:hypothetical protein
MQLITDYILEQIKWNSTNSQMKIEVMKSLLC